MEQAHSKLKTKEISSEFVRNLELVSAKIFPLPGAKFDKGNYSDSRIHTLPTLNDNKIVLYEHIATIRHRPTDKFFIAFRQTMDCLFVEQKDIAKYPEWLMKSQQKTTELRIHIYQVKERNGRHMFPKDLINIQTHEDYLQPVIDGSIFESLAYFLLQQTEVKIDKIENKLV